MRTVAILIFLMLANARALAVWDKYSPFGPGNVPPRFPLTVLTLVRQDFVSSGRHTFDFYEPNSAKSALSIEWADEGNRVSIRTPGATRPFSAPIEGSPVCDAEAATADLNGDALPDYVVVTHSGGNGLAAQITLITFLLSSSKGYVAREIVSYDAAPGDLVDLNRDGRPEFVHCMSIWGDKGKDGRSHNYWVYNLLGFSGTEIVSANRSSPEFPKWITYTYAANHKDSAQLTAEQRQQQWMLVWTPGQGYFGADKFPDAETFAQEQGRALQRRR